MALGTSLIIGAAITAGIVAISIMVEQKKVNAMTPDEKLNYVLGIINVHLVCPHCQTKGKVRGKKVERQAVSTGTVGGILKTNTKNTTVSIVTQHHCDHCGSTWDI